jgi:hypothetical protein
MRRPLAFAAALLAAVPGIASAAEPPCLTPTEFTAIAGYSMPSIINGTAQRCAATLAPSAYLRTSGKNLAERYAGQKAKYWPGAKAALLKLSSGSDSSISKTFRDMPDSSLQPIADGMVEGMISQQIPLNRCATIDRLVGLLAPLPPENTAELIALAVGLGAKTDANSNRAKLGKLSICQS